MHRPASAMSGIGSLFLGLPPGFNIRGSTMRITIFETEDQHKDKWSYDKLNVPVWMHLDDNLNTIVRGLSPRIGIGFIHIFLCDARDYVKAAHEISKSDIEEF